MWGSGWWIDNHNHYRCSIHHPTLFCSAVPSDSTIFQRCTYHIIIEVSNLSNLACNAWTITSTQQAWCLFRMMAYLATIYLHTASCASTVGSIGLWSLTWWHHHCLFWVWMIQFWWEPPDGGPNWRRWWVQQNCQLILYWCEGMIISWNQGRYMLITICFHRGQEELTSCAVAKRCVEYGPWGWCKGGPSYICLFLPAFRQLDK